jgi:hypothetical protein
MPETPMFQPSRRGALRRVVRLSSAFSLLAAGMTPALAFDMGSVRLDDSVRVGNTELILNGAGVRTRLVFQVYVVGLYLTEKKATVAEILAVPGPRRITIIMLRDVSSDDFGEAFMKGLNNNSDKAEKTRILGQTMKFGEMFAQIPGLKKGDVLEVDWLPGTGTLCQLNGKKVGEVVPDINFYNAILKIWIGDKPVDSALRPKLLKRG